MTHTTPRHREYLASYQICVLDCFYRSTRLLDKSPPQQRSDLTMLMLVVYLQWITTAMCNTLDQAMHR